MECEKCLHKRICDLWRSVESQDACCYGEDYFEEDKTEEILARAEAAEAALKRYVSGPNY